MSSEREKWLLEMRRVYDQLNDYSPVTSKADLIHRLENLAMQLADRITIELQSKTWTPLQYDLQDLVNAIDFIKESNEI